MRHNKGMSTKNFAMVAAVFFSLTTVLHILRVVLDWQANIGGWDVPMWFSWVFIVVGVFLAYSGFRASKNS